MAREARLELGERVTLDGEDVTEQIREPWVSEAASRVASDPAVREALVEQQRRILTEGDWVAEGRDIGTVVAPGAEVKVFLTARPGRARAPPRRRARRRRAGRAKEQVLRDERDRTREDSPLIAAPDAVPVDTTGLSLDEVVDQIVTLAVEAKEIQT